jgi:hypothetical protein
MEPATFPNVGNFRATEDWWFILPAILVVDVFVIFLARFLPQIFGKPINDWYDQFGLAAVLSDVLIIAIGIALARYAYSYFFQEKEGWNIWYFTAVAVLIQIIHDVFFAFAVVKPIPAGHNDMIDVFKAYISGGPKIIAADAAMVIGSIVLASGLKNMDFYVTNMVSMVTAYALTYVLYTNPSKA